MMSRLKLWGGLAVLFGTGVLTGILGTVVYVDIERPPRGEHGPAAQHERIMKRLTQELALTAAQRSDVEPIVTRTHLAILDLRFSHQPEIEHILEDGVVELKATLSSEQQAALDKMYEGLRQRWQVSRAYIEAKKAGSARP
jgi:hypothetical protein